MLKTTKLYSILSLFIVIASSNVQSAQVTGIYEGTIVNDSGLGLLGQIMRVQLTYENTTTGTPSGSATRYLGLVTDASVMIGANLWTYDGSGTSNLFLRDNDVVVFSNGPEDRVSLSVGDFMGPSLGTGTIAFGPTLSMTLSDVLPDNFPDAVMDDTMLPSTPFDPSLFDNGPAISNSLSFSWSLIDDSSVFISVDSFEIVPIPIPGAIWLFGAGLLGLLGWKKKIG